MSHKVLMLWFLVWFWTCVLPKFLQPFLKNVTWPNQQNLSSSFCLVKLSGANLINGAVSTLGLHVFNRKPNAITFYLKDRSYNAASCNWRYVLQQIDTSLKNLNLRSKMLLFGEVETIRWLNFLKVMSEPFWHLP